MSAWPFHEGEQRVHERLGVRGIEDWARKVVRPYLPEQHRAFHTSLPFLVAAARDARGRPWATLLAGRDGFVTSPDPRTLRIDARPVRGDALEGALGEGADLGLLGIEFGTRRRNRLNGRVARDGSGVLLCAVEQTFGNCPQYIREREWRRAVDRLDPEIDNARVGLAAAAASGEAELEVRLAGGLWRYWWVRGSVREGIERIDRALAAGDGAATAARARALYGGAGLAWSVGDLQRAKDLAGAAVLVGHSMIAIILAVTGSLSLFSLGIHSVSIVREHLPSASANEAS